MLSSLETTALVAAGVVAGLVGTAGGITSSVSYPVLLAVGLPALPASIANNIALVACWPGSALASQPELRGRGKWLRRWSLVAVAGGAAGAALLLLTSDRAFARIAPLLIVTGSLALLFEPRLTAWRQGRHPGGSSLPLAVGLFVISVYNGYFGGGSGIMVLTLMLVLIDQHVASANALKNMLIGASQVICAVVFVLAGSVVWSAAAPLGIGMLAGATLGPRVARRLPTKLLRVLIVLVGFTLAGWLWRNPRY
jgi:uncharacterized membrane protein YfcA